MNRPFLPVSFLCVAVIGLAGCASDSGAPGPFTASSSGDIARGATLTTASSMTTGAYASGEVIAATIHIIAKYPATPHQRKVAEARAQAVFRAMPAKRKAVMQKKKVRFIAVDTEPDKRSSPKAEKSVMIWDTQTHEVVGNNVYDVQAAPAQGTTARFETFTAEYVGAGT